MFPMRGHHHSNYGGLSVERMEHVFGIVLLLLAHQAGVCHGEGWQGLELGVLKSTLRGSVFYNRTHGWAVGERDVLLLSSDTGQTWTETSTGQGFGSGITWEGGVSKTSDVFAVGDLGLILHTSDAGATWTQQQSTTTQTLYDVYFLSDVAGYVVGAFGTILRTSDKGATWNKLKSGMP
eukprot:40010-Prorocentrum_minimum.AAC.2